LKIRRLKTQDEFKDYLYSYMPFLNFAPVLFVSAKSKQRVHKIFGMINEVDDERHRKIDENALDKFFKKDHR